jgi:hypothetical protein
MGHMSRISAFVGFAQLMQMCSYHCINIVPQLQFREDSLSRVPCAISTLEIGLLELLHIQVLDKTHHYITKYVLIIMIQFHSSYESLFPLNSILLIHNSISCYLLQYYTTFYELTWIHTSLHILKDGPYSSSYLNESSLIHAICSLLSPIPSKCFHLRLPRLLYPLHNTSNYILYFKRLCATPRQAEFIFDIMMHPTILHSEHW